jgi:hypothetical protein
MSMPKRVTIALKRRTNRPIMSELQLSAFRARLFSRVF